MNRRVWLLAGLSLLAGCGRKGTLKLPPPPKTDETLDEQERVN